MCAGHNIVCMGTLSTQNYISECTSPPLANVSFHFLIRHCIGIGVECFVMLSLKLTAALVGLVRDQYHSFHSSKGRLLGSPIK